MTLPAKMVDSMKILIYGAKATRYGGDILCYL